MLERRAIFISSAGQLADGVVTTPKLADGAVTNVKVNAAAAVVYSKLSLANSIVTGDIAANTILDADVAAAAAIARSKLGSTEVELLRQEVKDSAGAAASESVTWTTAFAATPGVTVSIVGVEIATHVMVTARSTTGATSASRNAGAVGTLTAYVKMHEAARLS